MKILAIETSSKICAVAVYEDNLLIDELILEDENTHSVKLMPLIDQILKKNHMTIKEIDLFAVDKGPGSFTGIRIGIATVKGFIDVTNQKAIGVSSLENLAYSIQEEGIICSLIDAKNQNLYFGLFQNKNNQVTKIADYQFNSLENIVEELKNIHQEIILVGDGAIHYQEYLKDQLGNQCILKEDPACYRLNAKNIALAAYNKYHQLKQIDDIRPLYLRKSNAERQLEEKNGNNS